MVAIYTDAVLSAGVWCLRDWLTLYNIIDVHCHVCILCVYNSKHMNTSLTKWLTSQEHKSVFQYNGWKYLSILVLTLTRIPSYMYGKRKKLWTKCWRRDTVLCYLTKDCGTWSKYFFFICSMC